MCLKEKKKRKENPKRFIYLNFCKRKLYMFKKSIRMRANNGNSVS